MIDVLSIVALGFFLGMRHATDPDHVIAVTTIVARHKKLGHAALIGAFWGVGHTVTILAVGSGIILFGWVIPTRVGLSMEFSVGLMLILLGVLNLTGTLQWIANSFSRPPEGTGPLPPVDDSQSIHTHRHFDRDLSENPLVTSPNWFDRHFGSLGFYQSVRPLAVGLVHGLAGSAAVALLVLTTIRNARWGIAYLAVFGLGTIAGMMLITGAMAVPFTYAGNKFARMNAWLRNASGAISVAFGLFVIYEIGFVNGLLTTHPHWTPR
jgi:high-affinity nickel permease